MLKKIGAWILAFSCAISTFSGLTFASAADQEIMYMDELTPVTSTCGYSTTKYNRSIDGNTLTILNEQGVEQEYEKGIGTHAAGEISYNLAGTGIVRFQAYVGIDRETDSRGTVDFQVYVDDELVDSSGVLNNTMPAHYFDIDLTGAKSLRLVFTDGGNGNTCDHADWCDAKVTVDYSLAGQLDDISLEVPKSWLSVDETMTVSAEGILVLDDPIDLLTEAETTFSSSDDTVATIDNQGVVTAKKDGVATITCESTYEDVTMSKSFTIIVGDGDPQSAWPVTSIDGSVKALFVLNNGEVTYTASKDGDIVIDNSPTGLVTNLGDFTEGLTFLSRVDEVVNETYDLYGAKQNHVDVDANETTLNFEKNGVTFSIIVRAYDDGVAFRYAINSNEEGQELTISSENTGVQIPSGSIAQAMDYINHNEAVAYERTLEELNSSYCMPLLYETSAGTWALISEAALSPEYCGTYITSDGSGLANIEFSPEQTTDVETSAPFESPWRFIVMGTPADINENLMAENLSPDCVVEDAADWVEPGVSSWTWLNRESTSDLETYKRYVDFSAEMGWEYLLLDEGWQPSAASGSGLVYDGYYDWTYELLDYAESKGVRLLAWQNHNDLKDPVERETRIKELADMGFAGIKPDFFNSQSQEYIQLYHDLMEITAEHHMLINIHGANKTTGERRTYPNAITREGVFGNEQDLFKPQELTARHNCMLPFTRNAVGPADYTPMLSYRNAGSRRPFTTAHMAALPVVYESGIQCLADRPETYRSSPAYDFFRDLPADWNETVMVDGDPGEYVNIARRSGDTWYMGIICNTQKTAEFSLDFLDEGTYYAVIYKDGATLYDIDVEMKEVTKDDTLSIPMLATGGAAVKLTKTPPTQADSITIDVEELSIEMNQTGEIAVTLNPSDTDMTYVKWSSSNPEVATVENGVVTALKPGTTTITAATGFGYTVTASCEITVTVPQFTLTDDWSIVRNDVTHWELNDTNSITITTQAGELYTNTANAQNIFLTPASGNFTATTKLTFTPGDDYQSAGLIVYANDEAIFSALRRSHSSFGGNILATFSLNGNSAPEQTIADPNKDAPVYLKIERAGTIFTAYYSFDNKEWIQIGNSVTNSALSANKLSVGLYAVDGNGKSGTLPATFEDFTLNGEIIPFANEYIAPTAIELNATNLDMIQYTKETLTATILPEGATGTITWESSDPEIATVEDGIISALKPGTVTITAKTGFNDEITASCKVNIKAPKYTLSDRWEIIRNDPFNWSINFPTSLTVVSQPGEYYPNQATAQNVFLTDPGADDFTVTTKLDFAPEAVYQTAGIIVYAGDDAMFGVYRRYHSGFGGNILATVSIEGSRLTEQSIADPDVNAPVYLKLVKEGDTFTAYYSMDNAEWIQIEEVQTNSSINSAEDVKVGLYTVNGTNRQGAIPATYEDFTVNGEVIPFIESSTALEPGDIDGNGELNIADLLSIKNIILGRGEYTEGQITAADYNDDGVINVIDLLLLKLDILNNI